METSEVLSVFNEHGVEYVVVGPLAAALRGAGSKPTSIDACFHQVWANCECLDRALEQLGAQPIPSQSVPIPMTAELRKAQDPVRFLTAAAPLVLQPTVLGLGSYDELAHDAAVMKVEGLPVRVLTVDQLNRWAQRACMDGEMAPLTLLQELWQLRQKIEAQDRHRR